MQTRGQQQGMSILGILCILIMLGFFAMCAIRLGPPYFESLSVRDIVERMVMDPETADESTSSIRRRLATVFNTNQIYGLDPKDVEVYRKKGKTYIDASYEVRVPIMWRIDAVLNFNDLHYAVGEPDPVAMEPPENP
ncbi:MAG: DUF4845 domain-containing protein [Halioglobus sp.]|nr:DUF4845 domain-containing protein [Halioglobus sp.]|tara:strand:+ start:289 stop:699 length:411 start_codon:yes stop_codon:yes gene_type:complete